MENGSRWERMRRRAFVGLNRVVNRVVALVKLKRFRGAPLLLLTTVGRTSGRRRTTPLIYLVDGDRWIVVASNGGADWEPGWHRNLAAGSSAEIEVDGRRHAVVAHDLEGAERDEMWTRLNRDTFDFQAYQDKVRRQIAVVALERAA